MKKIFFLLFSLIVIYSKAQNSFLNVCVDCNNLEHSFDFNSASDSTEYFFINDTSQSNNKWQLGNPAKTIFNAGYSGTKAYVTDTLLSYPINNVSSFYIKIINCSSSTQGNCGGYEVLFIALYTKINSDLSTDGGTIEISHNNSPWKNIIEDSLTFVSGDIYSNTDIISSMNKPGYSGTSNDWNLINISIYPTQLAFDTITLRFTFSSDSINSNKDGWMIGLLYTQGIFENISEFNPASQLQIYPNPIIDKLFLYSDGNNILSGEVIIYNSIGKEVFHSELFNSKMLDISKLSSGIYFLKYSDNSKYSAMKFIKL